MNDTSKITKTLEDSNILLKRVSETIRIKNETKEQKGGFLSMLLGTLARTLLVSMLSGKRIVTAGYGNKRGKGIVRAGYGSSIKKILILPHLLAVLTYKSIIKMSLDLMTFILEIIYQKK